jgi:signal transduction histidine kinase
MSVAAAAPLRVMLVEDNPGDVVLVREMLKASTGRFDLRHAGRLVDALTVLAEEEVDCLLLDLSLPDAEGMEGLAMVRERAPELPVVVLSGLSAEEAALEALGAGAQDYLIKGRVDAHGMGRSIRYAISRQADQEALRTSEEHRGHLFDLMLRAEEQERVRIATELHDDTIQVMTAALMALDRLGAAVRTGELERIERTLTGARDMLGSAVERTRRLTFELRPPLLEANGLGAAVRELAEQSAAEAGFDVDIDVPIGRFPFVVEELVYRVMREAIANVRKHAEASHVTIRMWEDGDVIHASVADDGRGFELAQARDRSRMRLHIGLDALFERVRMAGGDIDIDTAPGRGTVLRLRVPGRGRAAAQDGAGEAGAVPRGRVG